MVDALSGKESGKERVMLENNLAVDIEAQRFTGTGLVKWTFKTVDVETGDYPEDALAGFLPPEDGKGSGQGYVMFTIRTREDKASGTKITNSASIIFDTNEPIVTNEVFNTITDEKPDAASIQPLVENGAAGVDVSSVLSWNSTAYATSYDLWIWEAGTAKPADPAVSSLETPFYDSTSDFEYGKAYNWQVAAKNVMGTSSGPVWSFTTGNYLYYLRDAILLLQIITGFDAGDISFIEDVNYDGVKGLPEVIYNIQKAAGVK